MAALGDSISTGFNACGWYVSCVSRSWAVGEDREVGSHYVRLGMRGGNRVFAEPGASSADLVGQARRAVAARAEYVTVLVGAQDACRSSERAMTPVGVYRERVARALGVLREGVPGVRVFVASVPDLWRLWRVGRGNPFARVFWALGRVCPSMLAEPSSMDRADVARRVRVRARVMAYNRVLAEVCARFGPSCRTDGGAVFAYPFTLDHVSKWDFFHPNVWGQRVLAEITFKHGFGV
ncbi:GDSL-type esterase/lipase family protein [Thermoactinospora rubra]|uniref:GDSL-type esterase/lipase family protein n=1 Tax=Thermoactinospora rubra TaxID=1088767 RepID=UPI001F0AE7EB|nr:GDSL-type esterase/lipase family protein [Thermoactinospora rubra]